MAAEAAWAYADEPDRGGGLILFTEDGYLSYLEAYSVDGNPPTRWPLPHEIDQSASETL